MRFFRNLQESYVLMLLFRISGWLLGLCLLMGQSRAQLTLNYTLDQAPTCGTNNGSLTLSASGGTAPYLYALDGGTLGPGSLFTNLSAGVYEASVIDANQDTAYLSLALSNPGGPMVLLNGITALVCAGDSTGQIDVSGSGGSGGPYLFALGDGPLQANGSFSNLSAGTYFVQIRDAAECRRYQAFTLTEPSPVQLSLGGLTEVDCFGGTNAFVSLSASGGQAGGYQFSLGGVNFQSNGTFTGLGAGSYQALVEDADGCRDSLNLTLTQPPLLTLTVDSSSGIPCHGDSLGLIQALASGGTPPYSFAVDGVNFGSSNQFDSLPAANYPLSVQDANGCLTQQPVTLTQPAPLQLTSPTLLSPLCAGDSNGSISLVPQGGIGPYALSSPLGSFSGNQLTQLPSGDIPVLLSDSNGCTLADTFFLGEPVPISLQVSGDDPSCFGLSDGSAQATLSGGTGPLSLVWNQTPSLNMPSLSNLSAGMYQLVVSDSLGCSARDSVTLQHPDSLGLSASVRNDSCSQQNGSITLQTSGGLSPLSFAIDGNLLPDSTLANLGTGSYQAVAVDAQGCSDTLVINLGDQPPPTLVLDSLRPITCAGRADGYLAVQADGGSGTYQYFWPDLGVNGPALPNRSAGSYRAIVYDGFCSDTLLISMTAPDSLAIAIDSQRPPACNSEPTGFIAVGVEGGEAPYQFQWSHAPGLADHTAQQLPSGDYAVRITDARGCQDSLSVRLVNPLSLRMRLEAVNVRCTGEANGQLTALVGGGIPPYQYQWNLGANTARITGLLPGWYEVAVTDQSGCTLRDSAQIIEPEPLAIAVETDPASCADSATGRALVQASGGNPPYQYYWSSGGRDSVAEGLMPGIYLLQVQDRRQCLRDTLIEISSPDSLHVEVVEIQASTCTRLNGHIEVQAMGGTPGYAYQWDTPFLQTGPVARELLGAVPSRPYEVLVTDAVGCQRRRRIDLPDHPAAQARIEPYFQPDDTLLLSEAALYVNNQSEATAYRWLVNDSTVGIAGDLSYTAPQPGQYLIRLVAYDAYFACPDTAEVQVTVVDDGLLWVPNVFTPNGDGQNDRFAIRGSGIVDFQLTIFDRWGKELRRVGRIDDRWDGRTVSGTPVPEGAYAYALQVVLNNGLTLTKRGQVMVIR